MSNLQLRQSYREKIYNYRPAWILRWGVSLFFVILVIIIIASGFIKIPDVVPALAEITTINPPAHCIAKTNGKIDSIFIKEGQLVEENEIVVLIESTINLFEVRIIEQYLHNIDSLFVSKHFEKLPIPESFKKNMDLGELQSFYFEFLLAYTDLYSFVNSGLFSEEMDALIKKLKNQEEVLEKLQYKKYLLDKQFILSNNKHNRDSSMYLKGGISQSELEASSQNILQFKANLADLEMNLVNSRFVSTQTKNELNIKRLRNEIEYDQIQSKMLRSIQLLKANIDSWKNFYLLSSPVKGFATFTIIWTKNQNIKAGDVVFSVVPADSSLVKARLKFPVQKSGKVKKGQRVNIKLHNYPYNEFGMIVGEMDKISTIPNEMYFSADVFLSKGLISTYGDTLVNTQQLIGDAEILTDESSLLLRFFSPLKALIDEKIK